MFNYLGEVQSKIAISDSSLDLYSVLIPAICDYPIEACSASLPGISANYAVGDIVVVAELENGPDYVILGLAQKSELQRGVVTKSLSAEEVRLNTGKIGEELYITKERRTPISRISEIFVGDRVVIASGEYGRVAKIEGSIVTISLDTGATVTTPLATTFNKVAISKVTRDNVKTVLLLCNELDEARRIIQEQAAQLEALSRRLDKLEGTDE